MLQPLKKTRLYEEIVKQLKDLIHNGSLKPGDKLPSERELALQLNVSRTAIREALRSMESMGFIESKVGGGTFVRQITFNDVIDPFSNILSQDKKLILELFDVRLLLEVEIARLAARNITPEKAYEIGKTIDEMEKEIASGGVGIKADNAFHDALAVAAGNSAMMKILNMCGDLLSSTRMATLEIPGQYKRTLEHHKLIFEAVRNGDEEQAVNIMREHLTEARGIVENLQK